MDDRGCRAGYVAQRLQKVLTAADEDGLTPFDRSPQAVRPGGALREITSFDRSHLVEGAPVPGIDGPSPDDVALGIAQQEGGPGIGQGAVPPVHHPAGSFTDEVLMGADVLDPGMP